MAGFDPRSPWPRIQSTSAHVTCEQMHLVSAEKFVAAAIHRWDERRRRRAPGIPAWAVLPKSSPRAGSFFSDDPRCGHVTVAVGSARCALALGDYARVSGLFEVAEGTTWPPARQDLEPVRLGLRVRSLLPPHPTIPVELILVSVLEQFWLCATGEARMSAVQEGEELEAQSAEAAACRQALEAAAVSWVESRFIDSCRRRLEGSQLLEQSDRYPSISFQGAVVSGEKAQPQARLRTLICQAVRDHSDGGTRAVAEIRGLARSLPATAKARQGLMIVCNELESWRGNFPDQW